MALTRVGSAILTQTICLPLQLRAACRGLPSDRPVSEDHISRGHCLCGAVSFTTADSQEIGACHCGICRRWGGGPLLAVHCGTEVAFTGREHIATYASSSWAKRAFCKHCGTHLYYKILATGEQFIPAGTLDTEDLRIASQIYIDKKPSYYALANDTPVLTEQQVIEKYGAMGDAP